MLNLLNLPWWRFSVGVLDRVLCYCCNQQKESITVFNKRVGRAMDKTFFVYPLSLAGKLLAHVSRVFSRGSRMGSRLRFPDFDRNLLILIGRYVQIVFDFPSENKTEFQLL